MSNPPEDEGNMPTASPLRTPSPQLVPAAAPTSSPAPRALTAADEETDLWWGAYAGRTMLPSFLVCLAATGAIAFLAWLLVPRGYVKPTILILGGLLWAVQALRVCHRTFGFNYRLTTHRVFRDHGVWRPRPLRLELTDIAQVTLKRQALERLLGIGQVLLQPEDRSRPSVVLEGVCHPDQVVKVLREALEKARARKAAAGT
jgi:hypothetical protein